MKVTNGDDVVDLPDSLADILTRRGWSECDGDTPIVGSDKAVPMSYIPGLVDGVTMGKIRQLVNDGDVPFELKGTSKMVKPSDVRKALGL